MECNFVHSAGLRLRNDIMFIQQDLFLFAAFEAANFQIDFFGNPVMRTADKLSDATPCHC